MKCGVNGARNAVAGGARKPGSREWKESGKQKSGAARAWQWLNNDYRKLQNASAPKRAAKEERKRKNN